MDKISIKDYMIKHAGKASVVLHDVKNNRSYHIGYSFFKKDEVFYYLLDGKGAKGPFYFKLTDAYIKSILSKPMHKKYAILKHLK